MKIVSLTFALLFALMPLGASAKDAPIGLSLKQLAHSSLETISMPPAHSVNGHPRLSGISADKMTIFEVIGDPGNVRQATLLIMISGDPAQVGKRCHTLAQFMQNASPGWAGSSNWLTRATRQALSRPDQDVKVSHNSRKYSLYYSKQMSNLMLTVSHK